MHADVWPIDDHISVRHAWPRVVVSTLDSMRRPYRLQIGRQPSSKLVDIQQDKCPARHSGQVRLDARAAPPEPAKRRFSPTHACVMQGLERPRPSVPRPINLPLSLMIVLMEPDRVVHLGYSSTYARFDLMRNGTLARKFQRPHPPGTTSSTRKATDKIEVQRIKGRIAKCRRGQAIGLPITCAKP
jgi:hypothetical protein